MSIEQNHDAKVGDIWEFTWNRKNEPKEIIMLINAGTVNGAFEGVNIQTQSHGYWGFRGDLKGTWRKLSSCLNQE